MIFKNIKAKKPSKNAVEKLLLSVYSDFEILCTLREKIAAAGVSMDILPDDMVLKAFIILGDHDRTILCERVSRHLILLMNKGLIVNADIQSLSTPVLRLLAHTDHLFDELLDISQRIESAISTWHEDDNVAGRPIIDCVTQASGFYSQMMRLKVYVSDTEWLLVRPSMNYCKPETLQRVNGSYTETIPIHCDDGEVLIVAMAPTGQVNIRTITLSVNQEVA